MRGQPVTPDRTGSRTAGTAEKGEADGKAGSGGKIRETAIGGPTAETKPRRRTAATAGRRGTTQDEPGRDHRGWAGGDDGRQDPARQSQRQSRGGDSRSRQPPRREGRGRSTGDQGGSRGTQDQGEGRGAGEAHDVRRTWIPHLSGLVRQSPADPQGDRRRSEPGRYRELPRPTEGTVGKRRRATVQHVLPDVVTVESGAEHAVAG